jgi:outer membrane protein
MSCCRWVVAFGLLLSPAVPAHAQVGPTRVAVLLDGPSEFNRAVLADFRREVADFFGTQQAVVFPPQLVREADWTVSGVRAALDSSFANPEASVVLALGAIGSHELARRGSLPKPGIAALIIDAALEGLPTQDGTSGTRNLSYVNVAYDASRTLQLFHDLVPFRHLAVLIHPGLLEAIPELRDLGVERAQALGTTITFVPVTRSAAQVLRSLPADVDAAYLTPLEELPTPALDSLISGLTVRRMPTFSYTGRAEVERGVLASFAPRDDLSRRARRVAGALQRIRGGEDAGTLPTALASISQLTLNMATARAIGFSPRWETLTEAELINEQAPATGPTWTLAGVAHEAVRVNLELQAAERAVAAGAEDVRGARGALLPQVQAGATTTLIRSETAAASLGAQPERQAQGQLTLSQVIVSDQTWAGLTVAGHAQRGRMAEQRQTELDAVLQTVTAYLNVLRAKAIASVERANVRTTRSNLELAELRERTGASSLSDVYRWQAELAKGRRSVLAADARVDITELELNRLLNRPLEESFQTTEATVADRELVTSDPRLLAYFANPETFRVLRDFTVDVGREASPELQALDAVIAAQQRAHLAASRALWLPTLALQGSLSDVFTRGGAGATPPNLGPIALDPAPDLTWGFRLSASLPLFTGMQRQAARAQAAFELDRLTLQRQALDLAVAAQIRAAMHQAGASWASIQQAQIAADAARRNFDLVADAYARGAIAIITLLDAQQAALSADEAAANAVYDFLVDLMRVQRSTGEFDFFQPPEARDAFFQRLDEYYRAAGVEPVRR